MCLLMALQSIGQTLRLRQDYAREARNSLPVLTRRCRPWHSSYSCCSVRALGGVWVPVGSAVFKTVARPPGAVVGGFDSHTPLPLILWGFPRPVRGGGICLQESDIVELTPSVSAELDLRARSTQCRAGAYPAASGAPGWRDDADCGAVPQRADSDLDPGHWPNPSGDCEIVVRK
jgi:hypothetical protein